MKWAAVIVLLLCAVPVAAAQGATAAPPSKAARRATPAAPQPLPQQFAPPQEAYASFPEAAAAAPAKPSACQVRLQKLAVFQTLPVLIGPGDCGADDVVELDAVVLADQSKVAVIPAATLRCPMAEQVAQWVRDDVAPSLKNLPPLRALDNFASYDCRGRNNVRAAQMSEHGKADALDVRAFRLADGQEMELTGIYVPKDWRETIRASACARFSTVLGPGSDGYHEEHIHLDLEPRRNNFKICQWDVREPPPPVTAQAEQGKPPADNTHADDADLPSVDPIPIDEVPLPRPRPRLAANAGNGQKPDGH